MLLSDLKISSLKILKDGEFDFLSPLVESQEYKILSFINDKKFLLDFEKNRNITCIICPRELSDIFLKKGIGIIESDKPKDVFFEIYSYLEKNNTKKKTRTHFGKNIKIHPTVIIAKNNVEIGDRVTIGPNCIIQENSVIENDVIIGPNCLIGVESFTFNGDNKIIPQKGIKISKNSNLLGNIVLEKGLYKSTLIEEKVKIGYNSIVEHDSSIGKMSIVCSNVTITGRVTIGEKCYLGPGAVIRNGIKIESNSRVNMGAIVTKDVLTNQSVSGNFAIPHDEFLKKLKGT